MNLDHGFTYVMWLEFLHFSRSLSTNTFYIFYFSSSKTMFALNFANIVIIGSCFPYKIDTGNKNKRSFKNIVCVYSQTTFFTTYVSENCHLTIQTTFFFSSQLPRT